MDSVAPDATLIAIKTPNKGRLLLPRIRGLRLRLGGRAQRRRVGSSYCMDPYALPLLKRRTKNSQDSLLP